MVFIFDETKYTFISDNEYINNVEKEVEIMSKILDIEISSVSMHRPSKYTLESDLKFQNVVNTYSKFFFKEFKYISDSRMNWRENPINTIKSNKYDKIQILIHPFWYNWEQKNTKDILKDFINKSKCHRFNLLDNNFTNLSEFVEKKECD